MADVAVAPAAPAAAPAHSMWNQVVTFLLFFSAINMFFGKGWNGGGEQKKDPTTGVAVVPVGGKGMALWRVGQAVDLYLFLTPNETLDENATATWSFHNLTFEVLTENELEVVATLPVDERLATKNGSHYIHALYTLRGFRPKTFATQKRSCVYHRYNLVKYLPPLKKKKEVSLLSGGSTNGTEENATVIWSAYWQPKLVLNPVADHTTHGPGALPENFDEYFTMTADKQNYYPILYENTFWVQRADLISLNDTVSEVNLTVSVYPITVMKFMIYVQMAQSFETQKSFGVVDSEVDEMKRIFLETNPILLVVTMVVSTLHMAFEYLAFKNDITFWKNKKDFTGLSGRTLMMNCYFQTVICLYLFDGDTSWTVLVPSALGVLIEFWKLRKIFNVERTGPGSRLPYTMKWTLSYSQTKTKQFDDQAMTYLFYIMAPFLIGYAGYSLYNDVYKSWWSYIIHTQVRFIYAAGFAMMTPQLFINYKMKSVAHLPWRTFTYKALNTFIDDLFAFIIKMPMLHRLACLRDDLVFVILLYQRWIYPVDLKRQNEFGQGGDDAEKAKTD